MDAFFKVAGVVGFVASQDSLINLMDRVTSLVIAQPNEYTEFEHLKLELCKQKFHRSLEHRGFGAAGVSAEEDATFALYITAVKRKMEEIARLKDQASLPKNATKTRSVAELLDDTLKLIDSMATCNYSSAGSSSSYSSPLPSLLQAERERMQLLINLMRPQNKQQLRKKELKEKRVLLETRDDIELARVLDDLKEHEDEGPSTIQWKLKTYIVERVQFGTIPKEKERRLSRLGRLILNMCEWEDPCVAKMAFVVEGQDKFYIFSELEGSTFTFLENSLIKSVETHESQATSVLQEKQLKVRLEEGVEKLCLLIKIASAIKNLHEQMIVHEGIGSHNVVVGEVTAMELAVKLVGFVSARMVDDMSDQPSPLMPQAERRRMVYQAPWRVAGSRYSFECDVYSLGVVMAELHCGYAFVNDLSIHGRDDILALLNDKKLSRTPTTMDSLIQECMSAQASWVPPIDEVLQRLTYMLPR